jgi:hypothetical protein
VSQRVQVRLQHVVLVERLHGALLLLIAARQRSDDLLLRYVAELLIEVFGSQILSPAGLRRRCVAGSRGVLAVERIAVLPGELEARGLQLLGEVRGPFLQSLQISVPDGVGCAGVTLARQLRERSPVRAEFFNVRLQKQRAPTVEGIQITVQEFPRQLRVQRMMRELRPLQDGGREARDVRLRGLEIGCRRSGPRERDGDEPDAQPDSEQASDDRGWKFHGAPGQGRFGGPTNPAR